MHVLHSCLILCLCRLFGLVFATSLKTTENNTFIAIDTGRLSFTIDKTTNFLGHVHLDGFDLQGPQSNSSGRGYYECHCVPTNFSVEASDIFLIGQQNATFTLLHGTDRSGVPYAGVLMSQTLAIGHTFQQWYFARPGETGIHNFARLIYQNSTAGPPFEDGGIPVREIREVFQFNTTLWQTASTNPSLNVSIPSQEAITPAVQAQDATWNLALNAPKGEPYVRETSDFWTKYFIADAYRERKAHGLFGVDNETSYGAWMVSVTQDTLFGGPTHYDLLLDGMIGVPERSANLVRIPHIYYYFASSHQGAATSNLTSEGYDRTWGPQMLYFNKGSGASLQHLRTDAENKASLSMFADFYDSISHLVPGFVPPSQRGSAKFSFDKKSFPAHAEDAVAILSGEDFEFQSNVLDLSAFQYWADMDDERGVFRMRDVRSGKYRLTVYAKGVFGTFVRKGIVVNAREELVLRGLEWQEESSGTEIWRLGIPDRSAGEFKHGFELDPNKTFHPQQYRNYWGVYNFTQDFPNGVEFTIGKSDILKDWDYCQFAEKSNFTILFTMDLKAKSLIRPKTATLTVSLAGASGASGNEDFTPPNSDFPLELHINANSGPLVWTISSNVSSSCVTRSGISCFVLSHQYVFPVALLNVSEGAVNNLTFGLKPGSATRVMYDAVRLELK